MSPGTFTGITPPLSCYGTGTGEANRRIRTLLSKRVSDLLNHATSSHRGDHRSGASGDRLLTVTSAGPCSCRVRRGSSRIRCRTRASAGGSRGRRSPGRIRADRRTAAATSRSLTGLIMPAVGATSRRRAARCGAARRMSALAVTVLGMDDLAQFADLVTGFVAAC